MQNLFSLPSNLSTHYSHQIELDLCFNKCCVNYLKTKVMTTFLNVVISGGLWAKEVRVLQIQITL